MYINTHWFAVVVQSINLQSDLAPLPLQDTIRFVDEVRSDKGVYNIDNCTSSICMYVIYNICIYIVLRRRRLLRPSSATWKSL